jgi:hypothetical protein
MTSLAELERCADVELGVCVVVEFGVCVVVLEPGLCGVDDPADWAANVVAAARATAAHVPIQNFWCIVAS